MNYQILDKQLIASALALAGIDVNVFHSELNHFQRAKLIHEFTTNPSKTTVLVCSYYVNSAGSNLQGLCCHVHLTALCISLD
jgi:hypothetical protein